MLVLNERHLEAILREYCLHHNHERPHRSRNLRPPASRCDPISPFVGGSSGGPASEGYSVRPALLRDVIFRTPHDLAEAFERVKRLSAALRAPVAPPRNGQMVAQGSVGMSRVVAELRELASLTGDELGAQRLCWTDGWDRARRWLKAKCTELPVEFETDEAANQWITLPGHSDDKLVIGGHLDSVTSGGWLDGCLDVLAGLEVLRGIAASGRPPITVAVVSWADEEGARFGRSLFGSSAAAGGLDVTSVRDLRDAAGTTLPEALARYGVDLGRAGRSRRWLSNVKAYLELHIEQGPVLEARGLPLGVVLGTCGVRRHRVRFTGQAAHSGSTPMDVRRDALVAAARLTLAVRDIAARNGGVGTVGVIRAEPGLPTIVPGVCDFVIDQRHLDLAELDRMLIEAQAAASTIAAEERVEVGWSLVYKTDPVRFDPELIEICEAAVVEVSRSSHRMPSGPLHDATSMAQAGIPTGMIFVRSLGGLSHCKEEDSAPDDLELSVRALDRAVHRTMAWIAERSRP